MASADGLQHDGAHPGPHPDADDLALLAVDPDDPASERVRAHVRRCAPCSREVASLSAVASAAREALEDSTATTTAATAPRVLPRPSVWEGIAAATGVRTAPDPDALLRSLGEPGAPAAGGRSAGSDEGAARPDGAPAVPAQRRRARWSTRALAGTAVLALLVGAAGGVAVVGVQRGESGVDAAAPVAVAQLDPLPAGLGDPAGTGTAEVVLASGPGSDAHRVVVSTRGLPDVEGAAHEVWLLDPTTGGLLSLGYLVDGDSPRGGFPLPPGVDLAGFSAVDVSAEPLDGDAQHSGASELRGELVATPPV